MTRAAPIPGEHTSAHVAIENQKQPGFSLIFPRLNNLLLQQHHDDTSKKAHKNGNYSPYRS